MCRQVQHVLDTLNISESAELAETGLAMDKLDHGTEDNVVDGIVVHCTPVIT